MPLDDTESQLGYRRCIMLSPHAKVVVKRNSRLELMVLKLAKEKGIQAVDSVLATMDEAAIMRQTEKNDEYEEMRRTITAAKDYCREVAARGCPKCKGELQFEGQVLQYSADDESMQDLIVYRCVKCGADKLIRYNLHGKSYDTMAKYCKEHGLSGQPLSGFRPGNAGE